ncbi:hypothetical protein NXW30_15160 [Phocaeicola vulgatus]|nr:hypothetical protein [Phocaeicola vulgatus]
MRKKRGLGNEEAANLAKYNAEIAFNESQQSSSPEMMSPMQASGNVFYKALTTYQSSNIGYQRMGIEGLLEMARAKRIYNLNIESGMNKDEAQRTMMGSYLTGLRKATFWTICNGRLVGGRRIWYCRNHSTTHIQYLRHIRIRGRG